METTLSVASAALGDLKTDFYVIGTGTHADSESEYTKGRLLVFDVMRGRKLQLKFSRGVAGPVYAVNSVQGYLVAGINSVVCTAFFLVCAAILDSRVFRTSYLQSSSFSNGTTITHTNKSSLHSSKLPKIY